MALPTELEDHTEKLELVRVVMAVQEPQQPAPFRMASPTYQLPVIDNDESIGIIRPKKTRKLTSPVSEIFIEDNELLNALQSPANKSKKSPPSTHSKSVKSSTKSGYQRPAYKTEKATINELS